MHGIICGFALVMGVAACAATPAHDTGAATAATATTPTLVRVVAHDFAFDSSHTVPAGLLTVRLVNQGHAMHMMGIARLDSGKTVADVFRVMEAKGFPNFITELGGPGFVSPGDSSDYIKVLQPGNYALLCYVTDSTGKYHVLDGMISGLTVTGTVAGAPVPPPPDIYVRETDYHIALSSTPTAGHHVFEVDNDGPQNHDLAILRVLPGKTADDVLKWVADPNHGPPAAEALGGIVGQARWAHEEFSVDLVPGHYMVICLMPDVHDDRPHFMHGMQTEFTVD